MGSEGLYEVLDANSEVEVLHIDPRVGRRYSIVDRRDGQDVEHTGEYLEIDRPRHLVFTLEVPLYSEQEDRSFQSVGPDRFFRWNSSSFFSIRFFSFGYSFSLSGSTKLNSQGR